VGAALFSLGVAVFFACTGSQAQSSLPRDDWSAPDRENYVVLELPFIVSQGGSWGPVATSKESGPRKGPKEIQSAGLSRGEAARPEQESDDVHGPLRR